ncbi:MAG TPA: glycosyltransferase family 39 protein, partial [Blastocatellia bacterium]|nr:glycosyltransferase family 39 protein [Blastocatellia bacterium]
MKLYKLRPGRNALLVTVTFLVLATSTLLWISKDRTPPPWDPSDHLTAAYDYYQPLAKADFARFAKNFFVEPHYYAPFVHLVTAVFFLIFGASRFSGVAVNLVSLAVLLISVYWIGGKLYSAGDSQAGSAVDTGRGEGTGPARSASRPMPDSQPKGPLFSAGAVAAVLAACYHFPAWLLHDAFLDFPLIAIVAAAAALLIKADDFKHRRDALAFGVVAGLGLLTKQTFAFFFVLPGLYAAGRVVIRRDWRAMLNLALAVLVMSAIAAVWYLPHLKDVIEIYRVNQKAAIDEHEAPLFSFLSNATYVHDLLSGQIQVIFGLLFVAGLIYSLVRFRKESLMLYLWLSSGIGAFTLIANKDMRYTVPVLPAVALISVCWISTAGRGQKSEGARPARPLARVAIGAVIVSILAWSFVSFFNAQWPASGSGYYINTPHFQWMVYSRNYFSFDHRPQSSDWGVPDAVLAVRNDWISSDSSNGTLKPPGTGTVEPPHDQGTKLTNYEAPTLGVVVNLPYLNPSSVALYARLLAPGRGSLPLVNVDWIVA